MWFIGLLFIDLFSLVYLLIVPYIKVYERLIDDGTIAGFALIKTIRSESDNLVMYTILEGHAGRPLPL